MKLLAIICLGLCAFAARADEERPRMLGRFLAREDSLGFDEYRKLPPKQQLQRRQDARRWIREGNEAKDRGLDEFATAVGLCPYVSEAWLRYGEAQLLRGHDVAARYCADAGFRVLRFEAVDKQKREDEAGLHALNARVLYNLGELQGAAASLLRALEIEQGDDELELLLARIQGSLGEFEAARLLLKKFNAEHRSYARAQAILGTVELVAGHLDLARTAFDLAHEYGHRGAVFENDRGRLDLEAQREAGAIDHFEEAVRLRPDFMEARSNLAVAHRRRGDLRAARQTLEQALELREDYGPAQFNLAEILREMAAQTDAASAEAWRREAMDHYGEALRLGYEPELVLERRARLATELNQLDLAEQDFLQIASDPEIDGEVLHRLARVKSGQGDRRVALQLMQMAQQRGYESPLLHSDIGEILLRNGDPVAAIPELRAALDGDPSLLVTRVNLSIAYMQNGELAAAERELEAAERLDAGHELVRIQRNALDARRQD